MSRTIETGFQRSNEDITSVLTECTDLELRARGILGTSHSIQVNFAWAADPSWKYNVCVTAEAKQNVKRQEILTDLTKTLEHHGLNYQVLRRDGSRYTYKSLPESEEANQVLRQAEDLTGKVNLDGKTHCILDHTLMKSSGDMLELAWHVLKDLRAVYIRQGNADLWNTLVRLSEEIMIMKNEEGEKMKTDDVEPNSKNSGLKRRDVKDL